MPAIDPHRLDPLLRAARPDDAAFIYALRTDGALSQFLNPPPPSIEAQREWLRGCCEREVAGTEYYFIITEGGIDYGTVRLYDLRPESFCWGSWIVRPQRPAGLVTRSFIVSMGVGFGPLGYDVCDFDVRRGNERALEFYRRAGAQEYGSDEQNIYLRLNRSDFDAFVKSRPHALSSQLAGGGARVS